VLTSSNDGYEGVQAVCTWTVAGIEDSSSGFVLSSQQRAWNGYCCFLISSFPDPKDRSMCIKLALSEPGNANENFCVAFIDLNTLSHDERFKVDFVQLRTPSLKVVAVAKLHSASQQRWTHGQPVYPPKQAHFLDYRTDAQAARLHEHIASAAGLVIEEPHAVPAAARDPEVEPEPNGKGFQQKEIGYADIRRQNQSAYQNLLGMSSPRRDSASTPAGSSDLWGFLADWGCAPESAAAHCGCRCDGDEVQSFPEQATTPYSGAACREEPLDFKLPAPVLAAALKGTSPPRTPPRSGAPDGRF